MDTNFLKKKEKKAKAPSTWTMYPDLQTARKGNKHTTARWLAELPFPSTEQEYRVYSQLANRFHVEFAGTDDQGEKI